MKKYRIIIAFVALLCGLLYCLSSCYTKPLNSYPGLEVYQTIYGYKAVFKDGKQLNGCMYFSADHNLIFSCNANAFNEGYTTNILGRHIDEVTAEYGQPHSDIGSGFYIPVYISDNAHIVELREDENGIIYKVIIKDLITGKVVETYSWKTEDGSLS